jgi:hypothetical protein
MMAVDTQTVLHAISAAVSLADDERVPALASLKAWEESSAPGFVGSLISIVHEAESIPQNVRMLAAIVAKNAVGHSRRKTMGTKEWAQIPAEEKAFVRSSLEGEKGVRLSLVHPLFHTKFGWH